MKNYLACDENPTLKSDTSSLLQTLFWKKSQFYLEQIMLDI